MWRHASQGCRQNEIKWVWLFYKMVASWSLKLEQTPRSFSSVQSLSHVLLFVTPWTAAHQASLSITNSRSLLKLMSIESVMPSNHLILCHPLLLPPSIFPSIRVFSNESVFHIRWPKYWTCIGQTLDKYWTNKYWLRYRPRSLGGLLKQ